ncbi:class I SAM-dependent methyltransferase [Dyadobacter sp. 676]|uniref:Class I SAM-dependent methyltransferase n=1 Tax=Dyadobacter sp. 676 TaxID=3088362 RepID=A0AAU8FMA7_9BACT
MNEAYNSAITSLDIGLVGRNIGISKRLSSLILSHFDREGHFLDYGGGYGMLVRIMRDCGFDFHRFDTYCENIFARHFDLHDSSVRKFELLTAFELFEHLENPVEELEKMLEFSDSIFFSTELVPARKLTSARDWWYFTPETGQHIALYSERSLDTLARKFGCNFYTDGRTLHLITRRRINPSLFRLSLNPKVAQLVTKVRSQKSLLSNDFDFIRNSIRGNENSLRSSDIQ